MAAVPLTVVAAKLRLFTSRDKPHCEYLPQRWQRLVSRRLLLERGSGSAPFAATMIWAAGQQGGEAEQHTAEGDAAALAAKRRDLLYRRYEFCISDAGVQSC